MNNGYTYCKNGNLAKPDSKNFDEMLVKVLFFLLDGFTLKGKSLAI